MAADFETYFKALARTAVDEKTEHTDRGALETLLRQAAVDADPRLTVQHEPKRDKSGGGSPDYMVKRDARILGYVEVKTIDEALDKVRRSDQIKKYQKLSGNLLLTDYLDFIWIKDGEVQRARLSHSDQVAPGRKLALDTDAVDQVARLLRGFFSSPPQAIGKGKVLAEELAKRAALLRDFLNEELTRQEKQKDQGRLFGLLGTFRTQIFHDLTIRDFADAFAQMLAYGLFLARLNAGASEVRLDNVRRFIPGSFTLIRELVRFLDELNEEEYEHGKWIVEEIISIVNGIDLNAIHNDLSFRNRKAVSRNVRAEDEEEHRLFEKDPFIYFYEDFLRAYDPAMRKGRGVYYTPPPVVNFIVRAVDDILKDSFGIADGLADHRRVTVLDFACGTGTFILEVFERIFETIGGPDAGRADAVVREHLTRNIYGFEYLIAPYTIAHLKLSQYLKDKGHPLHDEERLQVFLTNTLEPVEPQPDLMMPALSHEVEQAQAVKDKPILVITGNPPYSAASKNKGAWITAAIEPYKKVDGKHFGEKKHWLHDDYVKFIRFAQMKMDDVDEGVVGIITNHSWLDNPTFRGMRQSLMRSFDQIYVLDLHGNAKKKEHTPDGSKDENVFDIEQGVAISLFVKKAGIEKGIWRGDLWGKRLSKYISLAEGILADRAQDQVHPPSPFYLFSIGNASEAYQGFSRLDEIFGRGVSGVVTARDGLVVSYDRAQLIHQIREFIEGTGPTPRSTRGWSPNEARLSLEQSPDWKTSIQNMLHHPFDPKAVAYDRRLVDWGRWDFMPQIGPNNVALVSTRMTKDNGSVFCTDMPILHKAASVYDLSYAFPLFNSGEENLSPEFRDFLDTQYDHHYSPEEILGYIYAVLHAPTYRQRYAEFLRIDFPRIPFAETRTQFDALSALGWELVQVHLLKTRPRSGDRLGDYVDHRPKSERGEHLVEEVRWSPEEQTVWINKARTLGFSNLPEPVWTFHIGGYQVLDKYLKSRKGRTLSLDEQTHVGEVAEALNFTIAQMAAIDDAYRAAFPDQAGG